jgi:hypothetical protein
MFETRPETSTSHNRTFDVAQRVIKAGGVAQSAMTRIRKGLGALICFYLAVVMAFGALMSGTDGSSASQSLLAVGLAVMMFGGLGYAGVRLMKTAIQG